MYRIRIFFRRTDVAQKRLRKNLSRAAPAEDWINVFARVRARSHCISPNFAPFTHPSSHGLYPNF